MSDLKKDNKKLILPAIKKPTKGLVETSAAKLRPLDLGKAHEFNKALESSKQSSLQKEILEKNQGLDLLLVGDLTGSMQRYHDLLKDQFSSLSQELFGMIENLRIGIIFYLDHDYHHPYVTRVHKISKNIEEMQHFIAETATVDSGCSNDEAVEDAFNDIVNNMNWREIGNRSVVLFGDARPHERDECPHGYDYFELVEAMYKQGIVVTSVFCGGFNGSTDDLQKLEDVEIGNFDNRVRKLEDANFFSWVANVTGGMIIRIENVDDLTEIIKVSAAKESGNLDEYAKKLKNKEPKKLQFVEIAKIANKRRGLPNRSTPRLENKK